MSAAQRRDSVAEAQARRRLAAFALASVALHAALLAVFQFGARRGPDFVPEPLPVQFVELEPPAPEPDMPDIPEDLPEPPPQEIPQEPEPEPEPAPEPQIPDEPPPEPEIPQEPAETPDIPAPEPTPPAPSPRVVTAPPAPPAPEEEEEAEDDDSGASLIVPGLGYRDGSDSALARFGHVIECAAIERRYDADCADVGPVYLTEEEIETLMPGGRLAPEAEAYFRAQIAREESRMARIRRDGPIPQSCQAGDHECFEALPSLFGLDNVDDLTGRE